MSQELGFKLHWMNWIRDANRPSDTDSYIQPVLSGASYYPAKCDAFLGDPNIECFHHDYVQALASDFYHVQMYQLFSQYYSIKLRALANELFSQMFLEFGANTTFVGVHIRDDFQYTAFSDIRASRRIDESDYQSAKSYLENYSNNENARIVYLVQGDLSISQFKTNKEFLLIEDWIEKRSRVRTLTRLQRMFLGIDVCSRMKLRMLTKFSNNYALHMGFHRLNNNMENVVVADVFSLTVYDYYGKAIDGLNPNKKVNLRAFPKNPYEYFPNVQKAQKMALDCFRKKFFGKSPLPPDNRVRSECTKKFDANDNGPNELGSAPYFQTDFF